MDSLQSRTSASLLVRLQNAEDSSAWDDFVARYEPRIQAWCRRWQLQEADADDVTQNVLLKLAKKLRTFEYDRSRSFRAWLKTVTRNAWSDFAAEQRATPPRGHPVPGRSTADGSFAALLTVEARDDLQSELRDTFDLELLERGMAAVQSRVKPSTWAAFQLTALEGASGAEAAQRLDMQVAAVYMAKSNVQKMLRDEIQRLETPEAL